MPEQPNFPGAQFLRCGADDGGAKLPHPLGDRRNIGEGCGPLFRRHLKSAQRADLDVTRRGRQVVEHDRHLIGDGVVQGRPDPLQGIWTISTPAMFLKSSPER